MENSTTYSKREAAETLGVSEKTIDRLRSEGELSWSLGRGRARIQICAASVAAFKAQQQPKADDAWGRRRSDGEWRNRIPHLFPIPSLEEKARRAALLADSGQLSEAA